jgi:uncharacterized alkaline shock family protein YloU
VSTEMDRSADAAQAGPPLQRTGDNGATKVAPGRDDSGTSQGGKTAIADSVVAKIVGMATKDVPGVYSMGSGVARAFGSLRDRIPGAGSPSISQGVAVEVGEYQAAVDMDVIVEYGVSIPELAAGIRRNVVLAIESMCGLEATEVNIVVGDIHLPGDDSNTSAPEEAGTRVQ